MKQYRLTYQTKPAWCPSCPWVWRATTFRAGQEPSRVEATRLMREKWSALAGRRFLVRNMSVRTAAK